MKKLGHGNRNGGLTRQNNEIPWAVLRYPSFELEVGYWRLEAVRPMPPNSLVGDLGSERSCSTQEHERSLRIHVH